MRTHNVDTNLVLHAAVDKRLKDPNDGRRLTNDEYARLVQITEHARSDEFQKAVMAANARHLYVALRRRISSIDTNEREPIWDGRWDPSFR